MKKNITLTADARVIASAREKARQQRTTLNALFREWLARYTERDRPAEDYAELMARLSYANPDGKFTRDELNER